VVVVVVVVAAAIIPYILAYKSLPRISRPPKKRVPVWSKIVDPRISRRWFFEDLY